MLVGLFSKFFAFCEEFSKKVPANIVRRFELRVTEDDRFKIIDLLTPASWIIWVGLLLGPKRGACGQVDGLTWAFESWVNFFLLCFLWKMNRLFALMSRLQLVCIGCCSYVSAMVPVKSVKEYDCQLDVAVLFSETLERWGVSVYLLLLIFVVIKTEVLRWCRQFVLNLQLIANHESLYLEYELLSQLVKASNAHLLPWIWDARWGLNSRGTL